MSFDAFQSSGPAAAPTSTPTPAPAAPSAPETSSAAPQAEKSVLSGGKSASSAEPGAIKGTKPGTESVNIDPSGAGTVVDPAIAAAAQAFLPEFKFKVMDKEHEIPEMFRALIKDTDTQRQVKEIFEKAYGLDVVKPRLKEFQDKYHATNKELQPFKQGVEELRKYVSKDDFDSFLKYLNIPEEKMLQWAVNKAKYMELPPEQRQVLDAKRAAEERAYQLEKEVGTFQEQLVEQKNSAKISDLRTELSKPDVTAFTKVYDQRAGKEGAFIDAVIEMGKAAYFGSQGKVDLTAAEAIQKVIAISGGMPTQSQGAAPVIPSQGSPISQQVAAHEPPAKKNTLPNLASKHATAVTKPKFTSLDALKKHAAKMGA